MVMQDVVSVLSTVSMQHYGPKLFNRAAYGPKENGLYCGADSVVSAKQGIEMFGLMNHNNGTT